jgi:hypothetical protein
MSSTYGGGINNAGTLNNIDGSIGIGNGGNLANNGTLNNIGHACGIISIFIFDDFNI